MILEMEDECGVLNPQMLYSETDQILLVSEYLKQFCFMWLECK